MKKISLVIILIAALSLSAFVLASPLSNDTIANTASLCQCRVCTALLAGDCKGVRPPTEPIDWPVICNHNWVATTVDPTCHTRGFTIDTCTICDRTRGVISNPVFRLRCDFDGGTTCTRCGDDQTIADTHLIFYRRRNNQNTGYNTGDGYWGLVPDTIVDRLIRTFDAQFENIFDYFARPANNRPVIRYLLDVRGNAPPGWASSHQGNPVSAVGFNHIMSNPWDTCLMVHELVHNAQAYPGGIPGWIVEGVADYGRQLFGMYNANTGWRLPSFNAAQPFRTNPFGPSAAFLYWMTSDRGFDDTTLVRDLNYDIQHNGLNGSANIYAWFVARTGYTIDELWDQYGAANFVPPPPAGS